MNLRDQLRSVLAAYAEENDLSMDCAIACATADLRHLADEAEADYGRANDLGYCHYCEEDGQRQVA
jgi:hypothetical protein